MENAWGTELLLLLGHQFLRSDEIIRLSNNWNVVQAYYAVYHATQALAVARGGERLDTHAKLQRFFVDFWGRLPQDYAPWCITAHATGYCPTTVVVDDTIHTWRTIDSNSCWSICCKALKTTRADAVEARIQEERETKKRSRRKTWIEKRTAAGKSLKPEPRFALPILTAAEKRRINASTRSYSMLDYLFRLRMRTNYVDSTMFTDGPDNSLESAAVRVSLLKIVSTSLFATELVLRTATDGLTLLQAWSKEWILRNVPKDFSMGVPQRVQFW
jgi:hypothetical protein